MRERISNVLRSAVYSIGASALMALLLAFMLSLHDQTHTVSLPVLPWAGLLLVLCAVDEILAPRGLPLLVYGALNTALAAAGVFFLLGRTAFFPESMGYRVLLGFMMAMSTGIGAVSAQKLPDSNAFIRQSDSLLVCMAMLMASTHFLNQPLNTPVMAYAAAALLLSLIAAARLRAGGESENVVRGSGVGGMVVLVAMLALCLALCAALIALGSGQVDSLVALAAKVWALLGLVMEKIVRVFAALLSVNFYKNIRLEKVVDHYTVTIVPLNDEQAMGTAPLWLVYGFLALLGLFFLVFVVALLFDFRGKRVLRTKKNTRRRVVTRKSHLLSAIAALFVRARDTVAFELHYRFGKRVPQTLYVYAQRKFRLTKLAQRRSESPGAYLRRLHSLLHAQGEASSLDALAEQTDAAIYGGEAIVLSRQEYAAYAAQIRKVRPAKQNDATK